MESTLFKNAALLDPQRGELLETRDVLVENGLVEEVADRPLQSAAARVIDLKGKTLMPGLIDLHVHVIAVQLNLSQQVHMPNVLVTPHTAGETERYEENVVDILVDNIERLLRGETVLRNQVV